MLYPLFVTFLREFMKISLCKEAKSLFNKAFDIKMILNKPKNFYLITFQVIFSRQLASQIFVIKKIFFQKWIILLLEFIFLSLDFEKKYSVYILNLSLFRIFLACLTDQDCFDSQVLCHPNLKKCKEFVVDSDCTTLRPYC